MLLAKDTRGVYNINKRKITHPQKHMKYNNKFAGQDIVTRRYINDLNRRSHKKEMVKAVAGILVTAIIAILAIDMLGFFGWAMSGQQPTDNFYIGSITTNIIRAII